MTASNALRGRLPSVLIATAALVGAANLGAYAATGAPLVLGGANHAESTTTLRNAGSGPALQLKTQPGYPPLAVGSSTLVPRLNADTVDGLHGSALQTREYDFKVPGDTDASTVQTLTLPVPAGQYLASYAVVLDFQTDADHFGECELGAKSGARRGQSYIRAGSTGGRSVVYEAGATAEVRVGSGGLTLTCDTLDPFDFISQSDDVTSTVDLVPLDHVTTGTATILAQ